MTTKERGSERFVELVAAYGSDITRWPEAGRSMIERLPPEERAELLRDDQALDMLIARAAEAADNAKASDALMARIMAATASTKANPDPNTEAASKIVALRPASIERGPRQEDQSRAQRREWITAAALLAASLVVGIFIGSTDLGRSTAATLGDFAGFDVSASPMQTTALDEVLQAQDDEDLL